MFIQDLPVFMLRIQKYIVYYSRRRQIDETLPQVRQSRISGCVEAQPLLTRGIREPTSSAPDYCLRTPDHRQEANEQRKK